MDIFFITSTEDIENLPVTGKRYLVSDLEYPGLFVRVGAHGCKSFVYFYRVLGQQICCTIGKYPLITLSSARKISQKKHLEAVMSKMFRKVDDNAK